LFCSSSRKGFLDFRFPSLYPSSSSSSSTSLILVRAQPLGSKKSVTERPGVSSRIDYCTTAKPLNNDCLQLCLVVLVDRPINI
jgi:hypothetical protein